MSSGCWQQKWHSVTDAENHHTNCTHNACKLRCGMPLPDRKWAIRLHAALFTVKRPSITCCSCSLKRMFSLCSLTTSCSHCRICSRQGNTCHCPSQTPSTPVGPSLPVRLWTRHRFDYNIRDHSDHLGGPNLKQNTPRKIYKYMQNDSQYPTSWLGASWALTSHLS